MLKTDVLVIGAGVIGLACSFYLAKEGYKVVLVDKENFASKASYYNGGIIIPNACIPISSPGLKRWVYRLMLKRLKSLRGEEKEKFKEWIKKFIKASKRKNAKYYSKFLKMLCELGKKKFEQLIKEYSLNFYYEEKDFISLLNNKNEFEEEIKGLKEFNVVKLNKNEIKEREPLIELKKYHYGILYPNTSIAYPPSFCSELINLNKELGVNLISNFEVKDFEINNNKVMFAKSNNEKIKARYFVVSAGVWSKNLGNLLGLDVPIEPVKGYMIELSNCKLNNILFFEDKDFGIAKYANNKVRIFGILEFKGFDTNFSEKKFKRIIKTTTNVLLCIKEAKIIEKKSCLRPFSPDELPIIGFTKNYSNLILACGHGRFGFMLSLITGEIVENLISKKKINFPTNLINPLRFT